MNTQMTGEINDACGIGSNQMRDAIGGIRMQAAFICAMASISAFGRPEHFSQFTYDGVKLKRGIGGEHAACSPAMSAKI